MSVTITNTTKARVPLSLIRQAVETTLKQKHQSGDISVVIVSPQRIRTLNRMYRGKDRVTDVLSFREAEAENSAHGFLGELFISYETVKKQAAVYSPSVRFELVFITIHGTLHLLGYDDRTDKEAKAMDKITEAIIKKIL